MLHIDKVVSSSMNHNLSDVKLTLHPLSVSDVFYKRGEKKILILDLNSKIVMSHRRLQSEQFSTVVICAGHMQVAEFNAT